MPRGPGALPETASPPLTWARTFPGTPDQAREARRFLGAVMAGGEAADYAMLCLSELVSNVLIHSRSAVPGGSFTVRVRLAGDRLRVEVEDQGGAWHVRPDEDGEHGHGLRIVGELAADWGITGDSAGGRAVWFEIAAE